MIDIPTALTRDETSVLQAICVGKHVLEIGALLGYSTVAIAQVAESVKSVDPHEGYPSDNPRPTFQQWGENLSRHGLSHKVVCFKMRWQLAVQLERIYPYEVVFMDLTGEYDDTKECLQYFAPEWGWSLKTIAVHDCGHPEWPGVDRAVEWMKERLGPYHYTFEQIDRLGVFRYV